jgi:hypothetical protein
MSCPSIRILSSALSAAISEFDHAPASTWTKREKADLSRQLTRNLLEAFDAGERDPEALKRAGLAGIERPSELGAD